MPKFLVVDDDMKRRKYIINILTQELGILESSIDEADNKQSARAKLKQQFYVAVFLDMALPLFEDSDSPDPSAGASILNEITKGRLKKPNKIIGFTALKENIESYKSNFTKLGFDLHLSTPGNYAWLYELKDQIIYAIKSVSDVRHSEKELAIVTVHGINTYGNWQEELISKYENSSNKSISHLPFKCIGIDFFTFALPHKRKIIVDRLVHDLKFWLEQNKAKRIICFSHSFGTYVLIKALEQLDPKLLEPLSTIVLSGSVLKEDYNFKPILTSTDSIIINDIAKNDFPLLISKSLILGTGMGGRVGFKGLNSDRLIQRFFDGGHSRFFDDEQIFINEYWYPVFSTDYSPQALNLCEKYGLLDNVLNGLAKLSSKIKLSYYAMFLYCLYLLINKFV
ncbi:hypothetical protein BCT47_12940 [Vibrio splendidus]|uniref:Response regulator n=1 Tax=Vibrio splendidus TaxID=29497 RepID=A0AB35MXC7_VIBSP|nr:response regulator [Vibrio splendidus]MDP2501221.1 response regulator [Vibrio splendidus]PMM68893.1 hypothetical protein BCT47_12940 [Vibrio splendidus]